MIACPHCGVLIEEDAMSLGPNRHVCQPSNISGTGKTGVVTQTGGEQPRMTPCPLCGSELDVSTFDPLERVHCTYCNESFPLLKQFSDFTLLKAYDAGWHNAVYLVQNTQTGDQAIVKVLSSHVLAQPEAKEDFARETEAMLSCCQNDLVSNFQSGQFCGFSYISIGIKPGSSDQAVLREVGISLASELGGRIDVLWQERMIACSNCKHRINVTRNDPLDQITCPSCNNSFELLRQFGDYRIDYRLNFGGTSVLYLAQGKKQPKKVALKILSAVEMQRHPESTQIFLRENEMTQKLVHPNVIHVYEGGQFEGFYYMTMELVEGKTLDEIMATIQMDPEVVSGGATPPPINLGSETERYRQGLPELICMEIMLQSAAGLGVAHENGLVHGDVKPENIMITFEGIVKVLDFGLIQFANVEKLIAEGETHAIVGTPLYIPPERVRGEPEDFRSDLYGLGATLYHLLRGVAPFQANTAEEIAVMHTEAELAVFRAYVPWANDATCRVVEKSLKKQVEDRYKSHIEFIADLTLAKNQILNSMAQKPKDGQTTLKNFMKAFTTKKPSGIWKRAETAAIRTYKYATIAITKRLLLRKDK